MAVEGDLTVLEEQLLPVVEEVDGDAVLFAEIGDRDFVEDMVPKNGNLLLSRVVATLPGHGCSSARVLPLTLAKGKFLFQLGQYSCWNSNSLLRYILRKTKVTDAGFMELKELKQLQSLNLRGTAVTDAGLKDLKTLNQLTSQNPSECEKVTEKGVKELQEILPKCKIER